MPGSFFVSFCTLANEYSVLTNLEAPWPCAHTPSFISFPQRFSSIDFDFSGSTLSKMSKSIVYRSGPDCKISKDHVFQRKSSFSPKSFLQKFVGHPWIPRRLSWLLGRSLIFLNKWLHAQSFRHWAQYVCLHCCQFSCLFMNKVINIFFCLLAVIHTVLSLSVGNSSFFSSTCESSVEALFWFFFYQINN